MQDGKFDAADRMFVSLADTWRSCLTNTADLKELIPEFYCSQGEFLRDVDDLPLGTTQSGIRVHVRDKKPCVTIATRHATVNDDLIDI